MNETKNNPLAVKSIASELALIITELDDDTVVVKWSNESKTHKLKIRTNTKGEPFFLFRGVRHYLHDFMKWNYP